MVAMSVPKIKNIKSLDKACLKLGLKLDLNKKSAKYYAGNTMRCDGVISCPGTSYEIALKQESDGSYSMFMDSYDSTLSKAVGHDCGKLSQQYQVEEHKRIAKKAGKEVLSCKTLENGTIELRIKT
jgi:hypothetical protein